MLLLLLTLTLAGVSPAQTVNAPAAASAVAADPRYGELRARGFQALYNLEYDEARRNFTELQRLFPDHPAGAQFLAACLTVETLNRSRRLQTSLYNDDSFYAEEEDKPDASVVREFRALTKRAEELAAARVKANPRDAEAHYFLGAARALRAAFGVGVERRFTAALGDGRRAVDAHRESLKLDPTFHDAELTIGIYDYVIGDLPLALKVGASMIGFRGSKKRGLATLERVVEKGKWANDDARILLIALYRREERPADSARLAREVAARYPRNHLFKLELADALIAQAATERAVNNVSAAGRTEGEAFAIFDVLLADETNARATPRGASRKGAGKKGARASTSPTSASLANVPFDLVHFKYAEALMTGGRFDDAAREYLRVTRVGGAEANLATLALLRAAQAFDLAGKRAEAVAQYEAVLARPNVYDVHKQATRGVRQPFTDARRLKTSRSETEEKTANGAEGRQDAK